MIRVYLSKILLLTFCDVEEIFDFTSKLIDQIFVIINNLGPK